MAKTSVRISRVASGRRWFHRWRWDVDAYRLDEGRNSGVFDHHVHVNSWFGYTATHWAALLAASRHIEGCP